MMYVEQHDIQGLRRTGKTTQRAATEFVSWV
jgi:hypothetical protein